MDSLNTSFVNLTQNYINLFTNQHKDISSEKLFVLESAINYVNNLIQDLNTQEILNDKIVNKTIKDIMPIFFYMLMKNDKTSILYQSAHDVNDVD